MANKMDELQSWLSGVPLHDGNGGFKFIYLKPPPGFSRVYAMEMSNGKVKIGMSSDTKKRKSSVQSSGGLKVARIHQTFLMPVNFARVIEARCHATFAFRNVQGEFFDITFDEACAELDRHDADIEEAFRNTANTSDFLEGFYRLKALVDVESRRLFIRLNFGDLSVAETNVWLDQAKRACAGLICFYIGKFPNAELDEVYEECKKTFDYFNDRHNRFTDTIKIFAAYVEEHSETRRDVGTWIIIFSKDINQAVGVSGERDKMTAKQLFELETCESMCVRAVEEGMAAGKEYHEILKAYREKLDAWRQLTK